MLDFILICAIILLRGARDQRADIIVFQVSIEGRAKTNFSSHLSITKMRGFNLGIRERRFSVSFSGTSVTGMSAWVENCPRTQ